MHTERLEQMKMIKFTNTLLVAGTKGGVNALVGITDGENDYDLVIENPSPETQAILLAMNEGVLPRG